MACLQGGVRQYTMVYRSAATIIRTKQGYYLRYYCEDLKEAINGYNKVSVNFFLYPNIIFKFKMLCFSSLH